MELKFIIPNEKVQRIVNAMKEIFPIPETEVWTDNEWAKECIRKWIINQVARYERTQAEKTIIPDNTLVT